MAFQQGLSGLNISSKALDVISNNIANASTIGFKAGQTQFADVFAASLGVAGASVVGTGASLASVQQQFSQGNVSSSNNPLDIAINGNGFFQLKPSVDSERSTYTRNGQFRVDSNGYIVNSQSSFLTGYQLDKDGAKISSAPVALSLDMSNIGGEPKATTTIEAELNLDDRDLKSLASASPNTLAAWDPTDPTSYNYSMPATMYDQRGVPHTLSMYFSRLDNSAGVLPEKNLWQIHYTLDGHDITSTVVAKNSGQTGTTPTLEFSSDGQMVTDSTLFSTATDANNFIDSQFTIDQAVLETFDPGDGSTPFAGRFASSVDLDFANTTVFGSGYNPSKLVQDGYAKGDLNSVSVSTDGKVRANYSNGQTFDFAQLVLFSFQSPTGLRSLGNNQWEATTASGSALEGTPGVGGKGVLQAAAVEEANIDLTQELVTMITQQRNYQANAQSIKTQDQILQTMINLR